jgi:hypothetical protein
MTETTDRASAVCSHLGLFALGTSFGVQLVGRKIAPLCQPTALTPRPCATAISTLYSVIDAGMVAGAVLVLVAIALSGAWRQSAVGGGD